MELQGASQSSQSQSQSQEPGPPPPSPAAWIRKMHQAWINENCSPEILPFESEGVDILMNAIADQTAKIEATRDVLITTMYQVELERQKYVLQAYLRARLQKIDSLAVYIMSQPDLQMRLSQAELIYAKNFRDNLEAHLALAFLKIIPEATRKLNEQNSEINMNPEPNLDTFVFLRATQTIGEFLLSNGLPVTIQENDIYLMRYREIQSLLAEKKVELL